jgi:hypothetical protein
MSLNSLTNLQSSLDNLNTLLPPTTENVTTVIKSNECGLDATIASLNVYGTISISLGYEEHPTCSMQLIGNSSSLSIFKNYNRKFVFYGIPFRVNSAEEQINVVSKQSKANVNFEGWHRYDAEKNVVFAPKPRQTYYTLSDVVDLANVDCDNLSTRIPINSLDPISTSVTSVINELMPYHNVYVDYNGSSIRFRTLGSSSSGGIDSSTIIGVSVSYKGFPYILPPTVLEWNKATYEEEQRREKSLYQTEPKFKSSNPGEFFTIVSDIESASSPPPGITILTPDLNFDMSGPTKTRETTVYKDDLLVSTTVETFGYCIKSSSFDEDLEVYYYSGTWTKIESYTLENKYIVENNALYYTGYQKTGWRLGRWRTESEGEYYEAKEYEKDNPDEPATSFLYEFFRIPLIEYENLKLEPYAQYYQDSKPTFSELYIPYKRFNGQFWEDAFTKNLTYFPQYFIRERHTYNSTHASRIVDGEIDPNGILLTGDTKEEFSVVQIFPSQKNSGLFFKMANSANDLDYYKESNKVYTSQDSRYANSFVSSSSTSGIGKPGSSDARAIYEIDEEDQPVEKKPSTEQLETVIAKTSTYVGNDVPGNSIDFPYANSENEAKKALESTVEKQAQFNGDEVKITTLFQSSVKPGASVSVSVAGRYFTGIVKTVEHEITILDTGKAKGLTSVTVAIQNEKTIARLSYSKNSPNIPFGSPSSWSIINGDNTLEITSRRGS